jgi:signal transduction histidine kinase
MTLNNAISGVLFPADRHRLEQVLLNLVMNALRAVPAGGCIEVHGSLARNRQDIEITVSDNGTGIAPATLSRIFEPGFSTHPGNTGLGLAVCRKIVQQHGGSIEARSTAEFGTSFTLTFPLLAESRREDC